MKLTGIFLVLVCVVLAEAFFGPAKPDPSAASVYYDQLAKQWDESDVKQFLKDRKVNVQNGENAVAEQLDKIHQQLYKLRYPGQETWTDKLKSWGDFIVYRLNPSETPFEWLTDYSLNGKNQVVPPRDISSWIFDTWSDSSLRKFLSDQGIVVSNDSTKDQLVAKAKENYSNLTKKLKVSGNYPGEWLYQSWSNDELYQWLKDYGVSVQDSYKNNREALMQKVRENVYPASKHVRDEKNAFLEQLNVDVSQALDKSNELKDSFFKDLSESQIVEWLKFHGHQVSHADLWKTLENSKDTLKSDLEEFAKSKAADASSIGTEWQKNVSDFVNDTFLIDVSRWPKSRLKSFLNSRQVSIPRFSTKQDLVQLVNKNRFTPPSYVSDKASWLFEGWSPESLKKWLSENGVDVTSKDDVYAKANQLIDSFKDQASDLKSTADSQADSAKKTATGSFNEVKTAANNWFDQLTSEIPSWSEKDLKEYLKSYGMDTKGLSKDELVSRAQQNANYFVRGVKDAVQPRRSYWSTWTGGIFDDSYLGGSPGLRGWFNFKWLQLKAVLGF